MMIPIAFWRNRRRYYNLIGNKCKSCGKEYYPPVHICKKCGSKDLVDWEMPKEGKVISYTILLEPAEEFKPYAPIYLGLIELTNGVKVIGMLTDVRKEDIRIGMKVRATLRKLTEDRDGGQIFYGYKFVPVE